MRFYITFPQGLKEPSVQKVVAAFAERNGLRRHELKRFEPATSFAGEVELLHSVKLVDDWLTIVEKFSHPLESDWPIPWSIIVTERPMMPKCEPSQDVLPEWILVEFFDSILLDASAWRVAREHSPRLAKRSKLDDRLHLYMSRWESIGSKDKTKVEEDNLEDLRCGPNAPPQSISVRVEGIEHLHQLTDIAYSDVEVDEDRGIGGRNALLLLSIERSEGFSRAEMSGTLVFRNESALNLRRTTSSNSLAKQVLGNQVQLINIVAEPNEERRAE